jgi:hypothetical protein
MIEKSISHLGKNRRLAVRVEALESEHLELSEGGVISVRVMDAKRETLALDFVTTEETGPIDRRRVKLIAMSVLGVGELEVDQSTWETLPSGWAASLVPYDPISS